MCAAPLRGTSFDLYVSDPWDFGTACGCGPFRAQVCDASDEAVVVRLDTPLSCRGRTLVGAVLRPRHAGGSVSRLPGREPVPVSLVFLARDVSALAEIGPAEPHVAAIGTVQGAS